MKVTVAYSPAPRTVDLTALDLPEGVCVSDALAASGLFDRHPALASAGWRAGVWGRACDLQTPVSDGDRIEVYRPLKVDPKEARRRRGQAQRRAATGRR